MQFPSRNSPGAGHSALKSSGGSSFSPLPRSFSTTSQRSSSESPRIAAIPSQLDVGMPLNRQNQDSFVDYNQEVLGLSKRQADYLEKLCMGNGIYALPSLSSKLSVKPAEGDGFCFVYSALAATGQADSERAGQACLRRAGKQLHKFVMKDVDPVSLAQDKDDMQATVVLKEQMMREEVEEGYLNQPGQELIAYSEQACYFVLSTSTPTDELMALGLTTFGELLAAMQHFSVTIIGSVDYGKRCLLVRHKHPDPAQEGLYHFEHFMPCMPAEGVFHTYDTPTQVFINHLVEIRDNQMLQEALGRGEGPYLSLLAEIQRRSKISQLLPAEPVKQQQLHAHSEPPPLITTAQLSVTQQGAESAASSLVSSDSQSDVQLDAAGLTLSAGELASTPHSPQLAGANSKLQLLQQESSSSAAEASSQARADRKLNSNKCAPDDKHQQQQQQQQQQQPEEGIPGSSKRGFRRRVKEACKAAGISLARGTNNIAAWLVSCPGRAATLIHNLAAAILGSSRPHH